MTTSARKSAASRRSSSVSTPKRRQTSSRTASPRKAVTRKSPSASQSIRSGRSNTAAVRQVSTRSVPAVSRSSRRIVTSSRSRKTRSNNVKIATKQRRFSSKILTAFLMLGGVVLFLILLWFFLLPSVLLVNSQTKNSVYVSGDIDYISNKIVFAHFDQDSTKSRLYLLDGAEEVHVPNGYGTYAVGAVPVLLAMDKQSDSTIQSIMSRIFRLPIDEIVMYEPTVLQTVSDTQQFDVRELAQTFQTLAFESLPADPQLAIKLLRLSFLARRTSQIENLGSYKKVSDLVSTSALSLSAEEKSCPVAVINTTGIRNVAREHAQLLEQNGVYIIREDSTTQLQTATTFQVNDPLLAFCESLLSKLLPFFPESSYREPQTTDTKRYRADIVIFLGTDITQSTTE